MHRIQVARWTSDAQTALDATAAAVTESFRHMITAWPGAWALSRGGLQAVATGVDIAALNGVWAEARDPDPAAAADLLDRIAGTGLPYCLRLRPGAPAAVSGLAVARGMAKQAEIPLMRMDDAAVVETSLPPAGLTIRQLSPSEAHLHATAAAAGFGAPEEHFLTLYSPQFLALPGIRCYGAYADDQLVATGVGLRLGSFVGILTVATLPGHRNRGYGTAVTVRAVRDGLRDGAQWAWLDATPAGYPIYRKLGFQVTERWQAWTSRERRAAP
jgi:N-acetylglutamate synthase